jgi:invasion protein IalB
MIAAHLAVISCLEEGCRASSCFVHRTVAALKVVKNRRIAAREFAAPVHSSLEKPSLSPPAERFLAYTEKLPC